MNNIDWYTGLWTEMFQNDKDKINHWKDIDKAVELDYELPLALKNQEWMRNIISSVPVAVIVTGKKVLSTIEPRFFIQPLNDEPETIKRANALEQNLLWQFLQMDKRGKTSFIDELIESALRYDAITGLTMPISWQLKGTGARYKAALNQGGFMTTIENPKDIRYRFSPFGLESVLSAKSILAKDAILFYEGMKGVDKKGINRLKAEMKDVKEELYVSVFDYWSWDDRVIRVSKPMKVPESAKNLELAEPNAGGYIFYKKENDLPFMPWTVVEGGTELATASDHGVRPILGPLVHTEQWELMCLAQSMAFSEVTAYRAAPRGVVKSNTGETLRIDYGDINTNIMLKPGESYERLDPPRIDDNLLLMYDRIEGAFNQLTGLRALAELDAPSGTAFATVNAQIKQATTALNPPKKLAERALSSIGEIILRWTSHTGDDLVGYGFQDSNMGVELVQKKEYIDPKEIYVSAILSHHIPTDRLQQMNEATMMMDGMGISFIDAAKVLDIPNPEEMLARANQENLNKAAVDRRIRKMDAELDLEIQGKQMMLEAGIQQQAQANAEAQEGGMNAESESAARMANDGQRRPASVAQSPGGPGFDPAAGGLSPNIADPEGLTREGATGIDSGGEVI